MNQYICQELAYYIPPTKVCVIISGNTNNYFNLWNRRLASIPYEV